MIPDQSSRQSVQVASGGSLVVPRQNQSVLVVPDRQDLVSAVAANGRHFSAAEFDLRGMSWQSLRAETQAAVIEQANAYTTSLGGSALDLVGSPPLIVTGHQPELFHAGVWAKNFAAGWLAGQCRGQALNLIIDNDTVATTRIKIPVGTAQSPSVEWIPFDATKPQQPWEESLILDRNCFREFGRRVQEKIQANWNYQPLVSTSWVGAVEHAATSSRLGDCLTAARVWIERRHGLHNLEVPMSRVCSTLPFCKFAALVLADLPRFHSIYNESVREYRLRHRLKSQTHPVPDLESADGWFEAPFWVWRAGDQRRERPFARQIGSELQLRDASRVFARLPLSAGQPLEAAAGVLWDLNAEGIRIRTRALTTTLFARLFLADLFVHGIGGAKYDAMTDQICRRFLGTEAPQFATVSATAHLPLGAAFPVSPADQRQVQQQIRDLRCNPDRHFSNGADRQTQSLITEKGNIISSLDGRRPTAIEHRRLAAINSELFQRLDDVDQSWRRQRDLLRRQLQANSILENREFSWCLQPEELVSTFLQREFPSP